MENHGEVQLRDRDVIPTSDVLESILNNSFEAYESFQDGILDLEIEQNWQWYTPHKAWYAKGQYFWTTSRGTKKDKTLYWLHVYNSYFYVAVWFKEKQREEALSSNVSEKTKQIIHNAKTEMGMPTFPVLFKVTSVDVLQDIYALLELKKKLDC